MNESIVVREREKENSEIYREGQKNGERRDEREKERREKERELPGDWLSGVHTGT